MGESEVLERQKILLLDLVESHFMELKKIGKSWGDHVITKDTWSKIAVVVNESGPHYKDADGWKCFFEKMKSEAKAKVGAQRRYINKTGSGLPSAQFSELDFKITSLYGKNHFDGLQGVRECGFPGRKFASNPLLNVISETPLQNKTTSSEISFQINSSNPPTKVRRKKRTSASRDTASTKCDPCGGPEGINECRSCNKIYCDSCDEMFHRHPLRQMHIREKVGH